MPGINLFYIKQQLKNIDNKINSLEIGVPNINGNNNQEMMMNNIMPNINNNFSNMNNFNPNKMANMNNMMNVNNKIVNVIFEESNRYKNVLQVQIGSSVKEMIQKNFNEIKKPEHSISIDAKIRFIYNGHHIKYDDDTKIGNFFLINDFESPNPNRKINVFD